MFCFTVAFARLLFPVEAKVAMDIPHADGNLKELDLNETPTAQKKRLVSRLEALAKTGTGSVEICCILQAAIPYLALLENFFELTRPVHSSSFLIFLGKIHKKV